MIAPDQVVNACELETAIKRRGNDVHVLSGIKAGDQIVLSGQVRLSNDTKVHVVENDALAVPAQTPML